MRCWLLRCRRPQCFVDHWPGHIKVAGDDGNAFASCSLSYHLFQIGFTQCSAPSKFNAFGLGNCPAFGCGFIYQTALEFGNTAHDLELHSLHRVVTAVEYQPFLLKVDCSVFAVYDLDQLKKVLQISRCSVNAPDVNGIAGPDCFQ